MMQIPCAINLTLSTTLSPLCSLSQLPLIAQCLTFLILFYVDWENSMTEENARDVIEGFSIITM